MARAGSCSGSGYPAGNTGNASQFVDRLVNAIIVDPANSQTALSRLIERRLALDRRRAELGPGPAAAVTSAPSSLDTSSPPNARILYAGISGSGVIQSTDGGQNWTQILSSATPAVATALGAVAGTRSARSSSTWRRPLRRPAAGGSPGALRRHRAGGPQRRTRSRSGLFISTDQGATWTQQTATGMPSHDPGRLQLPHGSRPASPGDGANDTIYFGASARRRSTDSGANFTATGRPARRHPRLGVLPPAGPGAVDRLLRQRRRHLPLHRRRHHLDRAQRRRPPDRAVLQHRRQARRDGQRDARRAPGQRHPDHAARRTRLDQPARAATAGTSSTTATPPTGCSPQRNWRPAPCTRVCGRPTTAQTLDADVTPWGTATEEGCYLATRRRRPIDRRRRLRQRATRTCGRARTAAPPGATSARSPRLITAPVSVARPTATTSWSPPARRSSSSTNALAATSARHGVTFTDITRNLPGRNVLRAAFDPNDPTVIYAVLGGFDGAGPGQLATCSAPRSAARPGPTSRPHVDVPFGALALDGTDTRRRSTSAPTSACCARSTTGRRGTVLDDIHFPHAPVTDLVIGRGSAILRAATYGRGVFEFGRPTARRSRSTWRTASTSARSATARHYADLQIFNVGTADLRHRQRPAADRLDRLRASSRCPATPLVVAPARRSTSRSASPRRRPARRDWRRSGSSATTRARRSSTCWRPGPAARRRWTSRSPTTATSARSASASSWTATWSSTTAGPARSRSPRITSSRRTSSCPAWSRFPLVVAAGGVDHASRSASSRPRSAPRRRHHHVVSNDPASPAQVRRAGTAPPPRLVLVDRRLRRLRPRLRRVDFARRAADPVQQRQLPADRSPVSPRPSRRVHRARRRRLPARRSRPAPPSPLILRFQPTSFGPKTATITVTSDDPADRRRVDVSGIRPQRHSSP